MHLDSLGLPIQADGNANDQLQRCGMIVVGHLLGGYTKEINIDVICSAWAGIARLLHPKWGLYLRSVNNSLNNVSADQLVSALSAIIMMKRWGQALAMFLRMMLRLGFAQNTRDGLGPDSKLKIPDFMFFRAMPLFCRASWLTWPLAWIFDLYLLVLIWGDLYYQKTDKDPADINDTLLTLIVCFERMPTAISKYACRLWPKHRDIVAALRRYHRAEAGGNPEIAELLIPTVRKVFDGHL